MPQYLSIIIPVHNSLQYTKKALEKLSLALAEAGSPYFAFHIIVVDDGSEDGSAEWIKATYPDIHILYGDGNLWWSGAMNLGMEYAIAKLNADFIIWWNNDIYPASNYFSELLRLLPETKNPTVFGSKIYSAEQPEKIWSYGGVFDHRWGHSYMLGFNSPDNPEFSEPADVEWLAGMGTIIPVSVIKETGKLNYKEFPQYHADIDYTYRAKLLGFKIQVRPELKLWNHTKHSGFAHKGKLRMLIPSLGRKNSIHNFSKEWLLYRKYAKTPLAFVMVIKRYTGYLLRYLLDKER